jgi:hypothetical protein
MCFSLELIQVQTGFKNIFMFGHVIFLCVFSKVFVIWNSTRHKDFIFCCFRVFCVLLQVMVMHIVLFEFLLILCFRLGFFWVYSYGWCGWTMIVVSINILVHNKCDPYYGKLIIWIKSFNLWCMCVNNWK